ncbi:MAG: hypothetical protein IT299_06680 [Dehalococcoidia bacterium]|nr:hypothetical protein [Dehalococcoidia bacterium]
MPRPSRALAILAILAMMMYVVASPARPAGAQSPPATYYGTSGAGDTIEVRHGGTACASAVAGGDGFWRLTVTTGACGVSEGGTLAFYRNGTDSGARETFRPGGVPSNVTTGVVTGGAPAAPAPTSGATGAAGGVFSGAVPPAGAAGLLVTSDVVTTSALRAGLDARGCRVQAFAVLRAGNWLVYIEGAPGAVNASFPPTLAPTSPFFVRC